MSHAVLHLSRVDHGRRLSAREFAEAEYAEGPHYERRAGRLVVSPPASYEQQKMLSPFRNRIAVYSMEHPDVVEHVFCWAWTAIDEDTDRCPDITVYLNTDAKRGQRIPERIPDIAFEVVGNSTEERARIYVEKREEYERFDVQEYVIADRFDQCVTVLSLGADGYSEAVLKRADTYTTPLLPGLEIPLQSVIGGQA